MEMAIGIGMFTLVVCLLVIVILIAKKKLVATGEVTISINEDAEKAFKLPRVTSYSALWRVRVFLFRLPVVAAEPVVSAE